MTKRCPMHPRHGNHSFDPDGVCVFCGRSRTSVRVQEDLTQTKRVKKRFWKDSTPRLIIAYGSTD